MRLKITLILLARNAAIFHYQRIPDNILQDLKDDNFKGQKFLSLVSEAQSAIIYFKDFFCGQDMG